LTMVSRSGNARIRRVARWMLAAVCILVVLVAILLALPVAQWRTGERFELDLPTLPAAALPPPAPPLPPAPAPAGGGAGPAGGGGDRGGPPPRRGPDPARVGHIARFVELHVEQGRAMADLDVPLAVCDRILPHGRWRLVVSGQSNHAGTTRLEDRRDPTLVLAHAILEARSAAAAHGAVATIGRVQIHPNAATSVADRLTAWLDCRAASRQRLDETVGAWRQAVEHAARTHGCGATVEQESLTDAVHFDARLAERVRERLSAEGWAVEQLPTAAGHDAGVLAARVPSTMLFVRVHGDSYATKKPSFELWESTGDGARRDENGYLWIMGRVAAVGTRSLPRLARRERRSRTELQVRYLNLNSAPQHIAPLDDACYKSAMSIPAPSALS
jgi:hypothetical protein